MVRLIKKDLQSFIKGSKIINKNHLQKLKEGKFKRLVKRRWKIFKKKIKKSFLESKLKKRLENNMTKKFKKSLDSQMYNRKEIFGTPDQELII